MQHVMLRHHNIISVNVDSETHSCRVVKPPVSSSHDRHNWANWLQGVGTSLGQIWKARFGSHGDATALNAVNMAVNALTL